MPICGASSLVLPVVIIAVEAIVLRQMLPGGRALRDSILINLASAVLGIPLTSLWANLSFGLPGGWMSALLAVLWALTVVVELLILRWLERAPSWRRLAGATAVANLVSYLLLVAVIMSLALLAQVRFCDRGLARRASIARGATRVEAGQLYLGHVGVRPR